MLHRLSWLDTYFAQGFEEQSDGRESQGENDVVTNSEKCDLVLLTLSDTNLRVSQ